MKVEELGNLLNLLPGSIIRQEELTRTLVVNIDQRKFTLLAGDKGSPDALVWGKNLFGVIIFS